MKTSDLALFEDDADKARAVIAATERKLAERLGEPCTLTVHHNLSDAEIAELFRLQLDAFGAESEDFDRIGLDEVLSDPESLFVMLWLGNHLTGASFAYWEWEDRPTVPGTDFFLDTGMLEEASRGKGWEPTCWRPCCCSPSFSNANGWASPPGRAAGTGNGWWGSTAG